MENVNAGVLDKLKQLFNSFTRYLEKMSLEISKEEKLADGGAGYDLTSEDGKWKVHVAMYPTDDTDSNGNIKYNIKWARYNNPDDPNPDTRRMHEEKGKTVNDFFEILYKDFDNEVSKGAQFNSDDLDQSNAGKVKLSKQLRIGLTRVVGSVEDSIELNSVYANYSAIEALDDIDMLLDSDEFLDSLPEDELVVYDIVPEEDSYEINLLDEVPEESTSCCLCDVMASMYVLEQNCNCIRWNSDSCVRSKVECLQWTLHTYLDECAGMCVELYSEAPNMLGYIKDTSYLSLDSSSCKCCDNSIAYLEGALDEIISQLDLYYCNFTWDIQMKFAEWTRTLKHYRYSELGVL